MLHYNLNYFMTRTHPKRAPRHFSPYPCDSSNNVFYRFPQHNLSKTAENTSFHLEQNTKRQIYKNPLQFDCPDFVSHNNYWNV